MLLQSSFCQVFDNSGIFFISCISLLKNSKKIGATICEFIVASVKFINSKKINLKYKKGNICKVLIIKLARNVKRFSNLYIKSDNNGVIIVNTERLPVATRFYSILFKEVRERNYIKIALLADILI